MRVDNLGIPANTDSTPEELSEYDRKLLAASIASNKELIIQSKRQGIQLHKVMVHGIHRVTEFITYAIAAGVAVYLYSELPPTTKAEFAEKYLKEAIAVTTTIVAGKQLINNRQDRTNLEDYENAETANISDIDSKYK
jgi:hypothetical protein